MNVMNVEPLAFPHIPSRIRLPALMAALLACALPSGAVAAGDAVVFLETEQFADTGGWESTSRPWM